MTYIHYLFTLCSGLEKKRFGIEENAEGMK